MPYLSENLHKIIKTHKQSQYGLTLWTIFSSSHPDCLILLLLYFINPLCAFCSGSVYLPKKRNLLPLFVYAFWYVLWDRGQQHANHENHRKKPLPDLQDIIHEIHSSVEMWELSRECYLLWSKNGNKWFPLLERVQSSLWVWLQRRTGYMSQLLHSVLSWRHCLLYRWSMPKEEPKNLIWLIKSINDCNDKTIPNDSFK